MPCFRILFVCPAFQNEKRNISNEQYVIKLGREYAAKIEKFDEQNGLVSYATNLCENEAADFLRDLPTPFYVLWIRPMREVEDEQFLYKNPHVYPRYRNALPHLSHEKEIFWNARQMERFMKN